MNKIVEYAYTHFPYDVFTDRDIAQLTADGSSDSRYGLVKRSLKKGEIIRIRRGLYCLPKKYERKPLNLYNIAQLIYGPSYISLESALSYHGWIPEGVFVTTSASMERSRSYKTAIGDFDYRRVIQERFYDDVDYIAADDISFFMAKPLKALCDYVYVYKKAWVSVDPLKKSLRIEEDALTGIKSEEFDRLSQNYHSRRVQAFIKGVRKDLGV